MIVNGLAPTLRIKIFARSNQIQTKHQTHFFRSGKACPVLNGVLLLFIVLDYFCREIFYFCGNSLSLLKSQKEDLIPPGYLIKLASVESPMCLILLLADQGVRTSETWV